jgi:AbiV family abortive infection protein
MKVYGMESPDSSRKRLSRSIEACLANSQRLVDESYDMEFREPTSTRFYLLIIAQEEAAKAFILHLVRDGVVPLSKEIRRAMNDHVCKQLVGILMDYLVLRWVSMEELEAKVRRDFELGDLFPQDIGSALEIFAYEKVQRWQSNTWVWDKDPDYDPAIQKLADGARDRQKQNALYVGIGGDGGVVSLPGKVIAEETVAELEKAGDYIRLVNSISQGEVLGDALRLKKLVKALRTIFGTTKEHPYD